MGNKSVEAWTVQKEAEFERSPKWARWPPTVFVILAVGWFIMGLFQVLSLSVDHPTWQRVFTGFLCFAYGGFGAYYFVTWHSQRERAREKRESMATVVDIVRRHETTADALRELEQSQLGEDGLPYWTG